VLLSIVSASVNAISGSSMMYDVAAVSSSHSDRKFPSLRRHNTIDDDAASTASSLPVTSTRTLSSTSTTTSLLEDTGSVNNLYYAGCLSSKGLVSHVRVCNSEDTPSAVTSGVCRIPDIDFMEIRIFSDNWDSVAFEAWMLQIILSEVLDVPTTIEAGSVDGSLNYYHPDAPMEFGTTNSNAALTVAYNLGDCRHANKGVDNYQACAHIDPERWTSMYTCTHPQHLFRFHKDILLRGISLIMLRCVYLLE
jgi:hypothetical protein